jgi:hypothetical protein
MKLVILTTPQTVKIDKIIIADSSSDLNTRIANVIAKKYGLSSSDILTIKKKIYTPDEMINKDMYDKADPTTAKMARTFVNCLRKKFGDNAKIPIKKSGYDGSCGLQSGARRLLNPTYGFTGNIEDLKTKNIVIVDDFFVSGSSLAEIYNIVTQNYNIDPKRVYAYTLGLKK